MSSWDGVRAGLVPWHRAQTEKNPSCGARRGERVSRRAADALGNYKGAAHGDESAPARRTLSKVLGRPSQALGRPRAQPVMAPWADEPTSRAYLPSTPVV